jgi:hypothetical protein
MPASGTTLPVSGTACFRNNFANMMKTLPASRSLLSTGIRNYRFRNNSAGVRNSSFRNNSAGIRNCLLQEQLCQHDENSASIKIIAIYRRIITELHKAGQVPILVTQ